MLRSFRGIFPQVHSSAWVDESAQIIGAVEIGEESSIWPLACLRADVAQIKVGKGTNIQDGTMVHVGYGVDTIIGDYVTVGHGAILHGCRIENEVLIGMGAILLDGVKIGANSIVAAGSIVAPGKEFPQGSLIMGSPAKVVRELTQVERENCQENNSAYIHLINDYK